MDKNTSIGFILILLIMLGYFYLTRQNYKEIEQKEQPITSINETSAAKPEVAALPQDTVTVDSNKDFTIIRRNATGTAQLVTIENNLIKLTLNTKGGKPHKVELKKYFKSDKDGKPTAENVVLFQGQESNLNYIFATADGKTDSTSDMVFTADQQNVMVNSDSGSISMKIKISEDQYLEQKYTLKANDYMVDYQIHLKGLEKILSTNARYFDAKWSVVIPVQEKNKTPEVKTSTIYYRGSDGDVDYISEAKYEQTKVAGNLNWISFKQQFFNSTLLHKTGGIENVTLETFENTSENHVKNMEANFTLPINLSVDETQNMQFYFGPNDYNTLVAAGNDMDRLVPLGWGIFRWVNKFLVIPVFTFLSTFVDNMGVKILLLTIIIKTLLLGLVYRSFKSTAKMKILKPEIDEIKAKHEGDMQKIQSENMKLYKKAGVSPMGGCLPMVLQMPVLIAVFQFFPSAIQLRHESFLWVFDLSTYDSIWNFGYIPILNTIYGDHVSLFTILMTISTLIYTYFNNQQMAMQGQMKYLSYIMPIFFLGFFNNYAAGLTFYYTLSNLWAIGQQFVIKQFVDENKLRLAIEANKKKPVKESAFQKRLQDMAKRQQGNSPKK